MQMTHEQIMKALSNVQEPDLGSDIVSLNMVKDLHIDGDAVRFTLVLTTPACPMKDLMKNASINAILAFTDVAEDIGNYSVFTQGT